MLDRISNFQSTMVRSSDRSTRSRLKVLKASALILSLREETPSTASQKPNTRVSESIFKPRSFKTPIRLESSIDNLTGDHSEEMDRTAVNQVQVRKVIV